MPSAALANSAYVRFPDLHSLFLHELLYELGFRIFRKIVEAGGFFSHCQEVVTNRRRIGFGDFAMILVEPLRECDAASG